MPNAFVQALFSGQSKTTGTTLVLSGSKTIVLGNEIFVAFASDPAAGTFSCADNLGNTYAVANSAVQGSGTTGVATRLFKADVTNPGTLTSITVTHPSMAARAGMAGEFSGVGTLRTTGTHIGTALGVGNAYPGGSGGTTTASIAGDLWIGAVGVESAINALTGVAPTLKVATEIATAGSGAATNIEAVLVYLIAADTTAKQCAVSIAAGSSAASAGAVYQPAATGPQAFPRTASDTVTVSDASAQRNLDFRRTADDVNPLSDSVQRSSPRARTASDAWTVTDTATVPIAGYPGAVMADGPKMYMRMADTTGTSAKDEANPATPGLYNGSPTKQAGSILPSGEGNSVRFTGGTAWAAGGLNSPLPPFTFETWINIDALPSGAGNHAGIMSRSYFNRSLELCVDDTGKLWINGDDAQLIGPYKVCSSGSKLLVPGTSYHVVAVRPSLANTDNKIYVNGVDVTGDVNATASEYNNTQAPSIGCSYSAQFPLLARMQEVTFYDKALSPAQIQAHYTTGNTVAPVSLTRTATDSWAVSDSVGRAPAPRVRPVVDAIALNDSATRSAAARVRGATDAVATNDSAARAPATRARGASDSVTVASDVYVQSLVLPRAVAAIVVVSDVADRTVARARPASDTVVFADTATGVKTGGTPRAATDSWTVTSTATRAPAARVRSATDTVVVTSSATSTTPSVSRSATDIVVITSTATRVLGRPRPAVDAWTVNDTVLRSTLRVRSAVDTVLLGDVALRGSSAWARASNDTLTVSDVAVALLRRRQAQVVYTTVALNQPQLTAAVQASILAAELTTPTPAGVELSIASRPLVAVDVETAIAVVTGPGPVAVNVLRLT